MSFSLPAVSNRRQVYLALASSIESQLRDAYAKRHAAGLDNQSTLAAKIGVDRSAINRRLLGKINMTEETIADMVWALGYCIDVVIYDPYEHPSNAKRVLSEHAVRTDGTATAATSFTPAFQKLEYAKP
jgi:hypothetical protein